MPFLDSLAIEDGLYKDLVAYQKTVIKHPGNTQTALALDFDLNTYFTGIYLGKQDSALKRKKNALHIPDDDKQTNWQDYARETVWYGRRRGATLRPNNKDETRVDYPTD